MQICEKWVQVGLVGGEAEDDALVGGVTVEDADDGDVTGFVEIEPDAAAVPDVVQFGGCAAEVIQVLCGLHKFHELFSVTFPSGMTSETV